MIPVLSCPCHIIIYSVREYIQVMYCCSNRKARGADFGLLTEAGHLLEDDAVVPVHKEDSQSSSGSNGGGSASGNGCESKYQTTLVDVYATFSVSDTPHSRYLVRHGAYLRVSDLVRSELRVADPSLAAFTDDNVAFEGLHPGQTQVQVHIHCTFVLIAVIFVLPSPSGFYPYTCRWPCLRPVRNRRKFC